MPGNYAGKKNNSFDRNNHNNNLVIYRFYLSFSVYLHFVLQCVYMSWRRLILSWTMNFRLQTDCF